MCKRNVVILKKMGKMSAANLRLENFIQIVVYKKCLFSLTVGELKTEQNDLQVQKSKKKARGKSSPAYCPLMCTFYLEKTEKVLGRRLFDYILLCLIF